MCSNSSLDGAQAFVYMAGLQLLLSAPRQALLGTLVGAAVGAAQRSNLLGLRDLRVRTPPRCPAQTAALLAQVPRRCACMHCYLVAKRVSGALGMISQCGRHLQSSLDMRESQQALPSQHSGCMSRLGAQVPAPLAAALSRVLGPLLQGAQRLPPHALTAPAEGAGDRRGGATAGAGRSSMLVQQWVGLVDVHHTNNGACAMIRACAKCVEQAPILLGPLIFEGIFCHLWSCLTRHGASCRRRTGGIRAAAPGAG